MFSVHSPRTGALCVLLAYSALLPARSVAAEDADSALTGRMYTDKTWVSSVGLGAQFLPDYDEDGRSSGLKRQELFADISVDGRFREDCGGFNLREFCSLHAGLRLLLLGTPVAVPADSTPNVLPTKFTDVASAVVFAPHVYWSWWQGADVKEDTNMVHNAGPLIRAGMISREELDDNKDGASWFYQVGLQYTYEPYRTQRAASGNNIRNGMPRGFVSGSFARFEDYANLGRRSRLIVDSGYQIVSKSRLYLGFKANLGEGPDDFSVVIAYYFEPDRIAGLFSSEETDSQKADSQKADSQ